MGSFLKSERKRLGLTLENVYSQVDIGKSTYARWEAGSSIPSDKLAKLHQLGFDVLYVITGERAAASQPNMDLIQEAYRWVFKFVEKIDRKEQLTAEIANELAMSIYGFLKDDEMTADNVIDFMTTLEQKLKVA